MRTLLREMALEEAAIMARCRQARDAADLTQEQVAEFLVVHVNTVANWENSYMASPRELARLAPVLQTTVEWLLHGDAEIVPAPTLAAVLLRLDRIEEALEKLVEARQGDQ